MEAKLFPLDGGSPIDVVNDVTLVGRKDGLCDLTFDRASISKLHCLLVKTDGLIFVRDLGSTNGTKVNGQRVTRGALLPGDELAFASIKFRVHLGPGQPDIGHHDRTEQLSKVGSEVFSEFRPAPESPEAYIESEEGGFVDMLKDDKGPEYDSESDVRLLSDDSID